MPEMWSRLRDICVLFLFDDTLFILFVVLNVLFTIENMVFFKKVGKQH